MDITALTETVEKAVEKNVTEVKSEVTKLKEAVNPEAVQLFVGKAVDAKLTEVLETKVQEAVDNSFDKILAHDGDLRTKLSEEIKELIGKTSPPDGQNAAKTSVVAKFSRANKFDNLEWGDLAFAHHFMAQGARDQATRGFPGPSEDMLFALALRTLHETEGAEKKWAAKEAAIKGGLPIKANELNQSDLASYGDEWAGVAYSNMLWEEIRLMSPVVSTLPTIQIPQGSESLVIPVEASPPNFYIMAQAANQAANPGYVSYTARTSRQGTAQSTATVKKIAAAVLWTAEVNEDSVVQFAPIMRAAVAEEAGHVFDSIAINGDTRTSKTTNINRKGTGNITDAAELAHPDLAYNGFRTSGLSTTGKSAAHTTLKLASALSAIKLFGHGGAEGLDPSKVNLIVPTRVDLAFLELGDIQNTERRFFTIVNDRIQSMYGYRYICSPDFARQAENGGLTTSDGKVSDTDADNTKGSLVAYRPDQWFWVMKRMMETNVQYIPMADSYQFVNMTRVGLVDRNGSDSKATVLYNATV